MWPSRSTELCSAWARPIGLRGFHADSDAGNRPRHDVGALTGLDDAVVSDHVSRSATDPTSEREQRPVRLVHSDFADDYADHVRRRAGLTGGDSAVARRIVMLQL